MVVLNLRALWKDNTMHKFILIFAILATVSMSSIVTAQRPGGQRGGGQRGDQRSGPSPMMMALDADKDGKLSAAEIANAATALKALDKNADGILDSTELAPSRGGRGAGGPGGNSGSFVDRVMQRDADGDGKISKDEAGQQMGRMFGRMDGDGDGFVTKEELETMAKQFQGRGGARRGGGGRPQTPSTKENRPDFDE